jgi:sulfur carrier protein
MSQMTLIINGDQRRVPAPGSAQDLLVHLGLDAREVVVEINEDIIRRPHLGETMLNEGDRIELVHFVGGG